MEPMDCDRLREVLFDHVDGLLGRDDAEAARVHLGACDPCRSLQEEVRRNFSALDAWEDEELPAGSFERLQARVAGTAPAPAVGAPAPARRSWARLAVPYAAGVATAAGLAFAFLVPHQSAGPGLVRPAPVPAPGPGADPVHARTIDALPAASPAADVTDMAESEPRVALRPGERPLEFRDVDAGVLRTFVLPPGIDPAKVMLVDTPARVFPYDEGVR